MVEKRRSKDKGKDEIDCFAFALSLLHEQELESMLA